MLEYVGVANGIIALAGKACGAISKVMKPPYRYWLAGRACNLIRIAIEAKEDIRIESIHGVNCRVCAARGPFMGGLLHRVEQDGEWGESVTPCENRLLRSGTKGYFHLFFSIKSTCSIKDQVTLEIRCTALDSFPKQRSNKITIEI